MPRISQIPTNDEYLLLADAYKNSIISIPNR